MESETTIKQNDCEKKGKKGRREKKEREGDKLLKRMHCRLHSRKAELNVARGLRACTWHKL